MEPSECGDDTSSPTNQLADDVIPESPEFPPPPPPEFLNAQLNSGDESNTQSRNRVSMISQQLEDSIGGTKPPRPPVPGLKPTLTTNPTIDGDALSVTSTLSTLSGCSETLSYSSNGRQGGSGNSPMMDRGPVPPAMPPPDYDTADSGTGDSESEDVTPNISRLNLSTKFIHCCFVWLVAYAQSGK